MPFHKKIFPLSVLIVGCCPLFCNTAPVLKPDQGQNAFVLQQTLGRDFWFYFTIHHHNSKGILEMVRKDVFVKTDDLPPQAKSFALEKAFTDSGIVYNDRWKYLKENKQDKTISYVIPEPPRHPNLVNRPFEQEMILATRPTVTAVHGVRQPLLHFIEDKFEYKDKNYLKEYRKRHPNFTFLRGPSEWVDTCRVQAEGAMRTAIARKLISKEKADKLLKEQWPKPKTREEMINGRMRKVFDWAVSSAYGDPKVLSLLEGAWCMNHIPAYWGIGRIVQETSRNYVYWQIQTMFTRGAARQFNIPWGWYIASYFYGYNSKGQFDPHGCYFAVPCSIFKNHDWNHGISLSAVKRAYYMAYLAGSSAVEREGDSITMWNRGRPLEEQKLSLEGKMYIEFFNFTRKNPDRGIPYRPLALLVPYARGYYRSGGVSFHMPQFGYTRGDYMLDAFMSTLLQWHDNRTDSNMRKGLECVMANHPYGDMCDVLTPDFPDQTAFRRTIGNYPAAILIGDDYRNPEMSRILADYVRNGGTLVINVKQLNNFFPKDFTGIALNGDYFHQGRFTVSKAKLNGAKVLRKNESGDILLSENQYGSGKVIVSLIHYMTPWDPARNISAFYNSIFGKNIPVYKEIAALLEILNKELIPVRVKGDIQYGLSKTRKGWWLYLINNKGVIKYSDAPAKEDPSKTATLTVDLDRLKIKTVRDLRKDQQVPIKSNSFSVKVAPGDVAILSME